ncbi:MAG: hypothetical protein ABFQ62_02225 [Patescibacteria group bacterium]
MENFQKLIIIENQYLKHEIADVLWLEKFHSVGLKLGWSMNKQISSEGHDERFFDNKIQEMQAQVSFIHLKPGRTFDENRPRVSPYISVKGEKRILIDPQEDIVSKLSEFRQSCSKPVFTAGTRHLSHITRLHDQLFEPLKFMKLSEKLQIILNKAVT